jgi:hypothetical protein
MKKLSILSSILVCLLLVSGCDKGELGPVMSSEPGSPSITSPESGQSYTLKEENAQDTLLTIEWTEPDYGFSSAPSYTVELGQTGQDFANPMQLGTVNATSYSATVGSMNGTLLGAGFSGGQQVNMELRVVASISDSSQQVSEPVSVSFTPYSICKFCPEIYVPGGYQAASGYTNNWSPADAPPLATIADKDQYEGYVYIKDPNSQFKFTAERNWNNGDWGDNGADGTLEAGGANIVASEAGYYKMNVDLNGLSYSVARTSWGLIGSATPNGWDSDQDMSYDPQTKVWSITLNLVSGEIKFRANDAWDLNYGDTGADGELELGGENIAVDEAGNYTVQLDLSNPPVYTYSLTKN